jgi:hypothetical protein
VRTFDQTSCHQVAIGIRRKTPQIIERGQPLVASFTENLRPGRTYQVREQVAFHACADAQFPRWPFLFPFVRCCVSSSHLPYQRTVRFPRMRRCALPRLLYLIPFAQCCGSSSHLPGQRAVRRKKAFHTCADPHFRACYT